VRVKAALVKRFGQGAGPDTGNAIFTLTSATSRNTH
jgi:hypothetical protein